MTQAKPLPVGKTALARKQMRALATLLEGDAAEQRATFAALKRGLNANRAGERKLFS